MNEIVISVIFLANKEQYKAFVEDASIKSVLDVQACDDTADKALDKLILTLQKDYMTKGTYRLVINKEIRTVMYYQQK